MFKLFYNLIYKILGLGALFLFERGFITNQVISRRKVYLTKASVLLAIALLLLKHLFTGFIIKQVDVS